MKPGSMRHLAETLTDAESDADSKVSAAPSGSIIPALPARPTTQTVTGDLITVSTVSSTDPSKMYVPYTVLAETTLYTTSLWAIFQSSGPGYIAPLINNGTIWNEVSAASETTLSAIGRPNNVRGVQNSGTIVLHADATAQRNSIAFQEANIDNNSGQIFVINEGAGNAWALTTFLGGVNVNSGTVAVQAQHGMAFGYYFNNDGVVQNTASGRILVEGYKDAIAVLITRDAPPNITQVDNAGLISARVTGPDDVSIGIYASGLGIYDYNNTINNSGTIRADIAIYGGDDTATVSQNVVQVVHNRAGGLIDGAIYLGRGADSLDNAGTINGNVDMGDGADLLDNTAGKIDGVSWMGSGDDVYRGGEGVDLAAGDEGNDQIHGNGGNDLLIGGGGNDVLIGGLGNDSLIGEWGNDRLVTLGSDYVEGGDGDDRIELGDYTFVSIDGGDGFDTVVLPGGTRTLDLSSTLAEGAFVDIEQIVLGGDKRLTVRATDVVGMTGGEFELRIVTAASDHVDLVGSWTQGSDRTIGGALFHVYSSGGSSVLVSGTGAVTSGAMPAAAGALDPVAGNAPPLPGDGLLDYTSPIVYHSNYEINETTTNPYYASWLSDDGTPVVTGYTSGVTLTNNGRILSARGAGDPSYNPAFAMKVPNLEYIVNTGTIGVDNLSTGGGAASFAVSGGYLSHVENRGTIYANAAAMRAEAVSSGQIANYGDIRAVNAAGVAYGVEMLGQLFSNYGTISAVAQSAGEFTVLLPGILRGMYGLPLAVGVRLAEGDNLLNAGTITASGPTPTDSAAVSFDLYGAATLTNTGTLSGGYAIFGRAANGSMGSVHFINQNLSNGDIQLTSNGDQIDNNGVINGNVYLGAGNDVFDGHAGQQTGLIDGGDGNDRLIGGAGGEVLTGGLGVDLLTGGAGDDTFRDSTAGLNGDTIVDFSGGDRIVISDATLASFSFNVSGHTLTYAGGSATLSGTLPHAQLVASAAAGGGVALSWGAPLPTAHDDLNGDGKSDIMWRNVGGTLTDWLGNGSTFVANNGATGFADPSWKIAGTGDFDGDGKVDILWRHTGGAVTDWLSNGAGFTANAAASATAGTDWQIAGTGDFNGDGKADILWRNAGGAVTDWLSTGVGFASNASADRSVGTDWQVAGTGDFNGDGKTDILWRNASGAVTDWLSTGSGFADNPAASISVTNDWQIAGTGDFNGDGRDDIVWRNTNGAYAEWTSTATGAFAAASDGSGWVGNDWQIVGTGDYNGDGNADILWRNINGSLTDWFSTGHGFTPNALNTGAAGADWFIVHP